MKDTKPVYSLHATLNLPQRTALIHLIHYLPLTRDGYSSVLEKHDMYQLSYAFVVIRPLEVQVTEMERNVKALNGLQALVNGGFVL
jgi:hypothetical protein